MRAKNFLLLGFLLFLTFVTQGCLETCQDEGNGGGYSGMQCRPPSSSTGDGRREFYRFTEEDDCGPEGGFTHSGVLSQSGSKYNYQSDGCQGASEEIDNKEVTTFYFDSDVVAFRDQIFTTQKQKYYSETLCVYQEGKYGVSFLVQKYKDRLSIRSRGFLKSDNRFIYISKDFVDVVRSEDINSIFYKNSQISIDIDVTTNSQDFGTHPGQVYSDGQTLAVSCLIERGKEFTFTK